MTDEPLFIVHWKSKITGKQSHGMPVPKSHAEAAVERGNRVFSHLEHWIEPVEEVPELAETQH